MATCNVYGTMLGTDGAVQTSVTVYARLVSPVVVGTSLVTPFEVNAATDSSGNFTLTVQQSVTVIFTVDYPATAAEPIRSYSYTGTIPAAATAAFTSIITIE